MAVSTATATTEFVAASCVAFTDGGPDELMLLHSGSKESCVEVAKMISGLSYSGTRPVDQARSGVVWMPVVDWDALPNQARPAAV